MAIEYLKCGQGNQEMKALILVKYLHSHLWLVVTVLDSAILDGWASEETDFEEAESTVCWTLVGWGHYLQAVWEPGQGLGVGQLCSRALADAPGLIPGFFLVLSWAEKRGKLMTLRKYLSRHSFFLMSNEWKYKSPHLYRWSFFTNANQ